MSCLLPRIKFNYSLWPYAHCRMFELVNQPKPEQMCNENYAFFSGTSKLMAVHFEEFVIHVMQDYLQDKHLILESGIGTSIHDAIELVGEIVSKYTGKKVAVKTVEPPVDLLSIEFRNFVADISLLTGYLDISTPISLDQGIWKTLEYCIK